MGPSRRPGPHTGRGVVARAVVAGALAIGLVACGSDDVEVGSPELSAADTRTCTTLVAALPDSLGGEPRRPVDPPDALGAAWGEPPYVLTCGVARPAEWAPESECTDVHGVGWFVTESEQFDPGADLTAYALTHEPHVSLMVPSPYRREGLDQALTDLAPLFEAHLEPGRPCL